MAARLAQNPQKTAGFCGVRYRNDLAEASSYHENILRTFLWYESRRIIDTIDKKLRSRALIMGIYCRRLLRFRNCPAWNLSTIVIKTAVDHAKVSRPVIASPPSRLRH